MNGKVRYLVGAALGAALLAGTAVSAAAQTPTPAAGAGPYCGAGAGGRWGASASPVGALASLAGVETSDIAAERQAGKSLAQIAAEKGVDKAQLIGAAVAGRVEELDRLVEAGRITAEQKDLMLEQMKSRIATAIERTTVGPMGPANGARMGQRWQDDDGSGTQRQPGPRGRMGGGFGVGGSR